MLSCIFHKSLRPFNMLSVEGSSEKTLFREGPNQDFESLQFPKYNSYDDDLFKKNL